jgi:hypothetical protein
MFSAAVLYSASLANVGGAGAGGCMSEISSVLTADS